MSHSDEAIALLAELTGVDDQAKLRELLQDCNGDVNQAVNTHFALMSASTQQSMGSGVNVAAHEPVQAVPQLGQLERVEPQYRREVVRPSSGTESLQHQQHQQPEEQQPEEQQLGEQQLGEEQEQSWTQWIESWPLGWLVTFGWSLLPWTRAPLPLPPVSHVLARRLPSLGLTLPEPMSEPMSEPTDRQFPRFFEGPIALALAEAARCRRPLFVLLLADDSAAEDALLAEGLPRNADILNERFLLSVRQVRQSDASSLLRHFPRTPSFVLLRPPNNNNNSNNNNSNSNSLVSVRFEVLHMHPAASACPSDLLRRLLLHVATSFEQQELQRQQLQRVHEMDRELRRQQDAAYEESLRHDRELQRRNREKREREQYLQSLVPEEPAKDESDVIELHLRLPNGASARRRFRLSHTIEQVRAFVEVHHGTHLVAPSDDRAIENWALLQNMPRHVFNDLQQTLGDAGLRRAARLFVQEQFDA